jgi:hypothetical protein
MSCGGDSNRRDVQQQFDSGYQFVNTTPSVEIVNVTNSIMSATFLCSSHPMPTNMTCPCRYLAWSRLPGVNVSGAIPGYT